MTSRKHRAQIAAETVAIVQAGGYTAPSGTRVSIKESVAAATAGTILATPQDSRALRRAADQAMAERQFETIFEVNNETTFSAARRLVEQYGGEATAALNFASAKNAGGGFLNGSQAQEESLARASALYACLQRCPDYYQAHRQSGTPLYTDRLIISPRTPVFRDDADNLLERPWETTILTSPAPNAGALRDRYASHQNQVEGTFRQRIEFVLSAAVAHHQTALVLGAWGCGVFQNNPRMVARLFGEFLLAPGPFAAAFQHVAFAVLDRAGDTIAPFAEMFGSAK